MSEKHKKVGGREAEEYVILVGGRAAVVGPVVGRARGRRELWMSSWALRL